LFFNRQKLVRVIYRYIFIIGFALSTKLCGQSTFVLPLQGKSYLTGNYGEIRPNHFHAGLDFKTDPEKNLPIYAVADGYVSRIKVSTHGYGKALYITHANGLVSVYGHQYAYNSAIKKYVEAEQLRQETFEIELFPKPKELLVKQGEIIGYSGNTGDSEGPHLHFEIRDEKSEVPLNPLRFLKIADTVAPKISLIAFYEDDYTNPEINPLLLKNHRYEDTVSVSNKLGIGVVCGDLETKYGNWNNIYKAELLLDDKIFYSHILDSIPFDLARYVNTYCDYDEKRKHKIKIQKCFVGKNNDLPIYRTDEKKGFIYLSDTLYHKLTIKVYDFYDHSDEVRRIIKRKPATKEKPIVVLPVNCLKTYKNSTSNYTVEFPEKSLYKDVAMKDSFAHNTFYLYAKDYDVPFQKNCTLAIKPNDNLVKYAEKLCIAEVSGNAYSYSGGNLENGFVKTTVKNFGTYKVFLDTVAPQIKFVKPKKKKQFSEGDIISFKVGDEFSGIGKFKLTINEVFQLAEYEHKTGMIFLKIRDTTPKGKIKVKLVLDDKKNNRATSEIELITLQVK
jgi:hypothetical protein